MLSKQDVKNRKKSYSLFFIWLIVNSLLWLPFNTIVGYINLGIYGYQSSSSPIGFVAGIIGGLLFGIIQWIILSRNFSISPLWILSWVIGLTAYYMINWYTGAILMGAFQQYLIRKKLNDSFLWFIALFISLATTWLLVEMESLSYLSMSFCFSFFIYGATYALPTGILLFWYKNRLRSENSSFIKQESV